VQQRPDCGRLRQVAPPRDLEIRAEVIPDGQHANVWPQSQAISFASTAPTATLSGAGAVRGHGRKSRFAIFQPG
jgi:hypothetical protein